MRKPKDPLYGARLAAWRIIASYEVFLLGDILEDITTSTNLTEVETRAFADDLISREIIEACERIVPSADPEFLHALTVPSAAPSRAKHEAYWKPRAWQTMRIKRRFTISDLLIAMEEGIVTPVEMKHFCSTLVDRGALRQESAQSPGEETPENYIYALAKDFGPSFVDSSSPQEESEPPSSKEKRSSTLPLWEDNPDERFEAADVQVGIEEVRVLGAVAGHRYTKKSGIPPVFRRARHEPVRIEIGEETSLSCSREGWTLRGDKRFVRSLAQTAREIHNFKNKQIRIATDPMAALTDKEFGLYNVLGLPLSEKVRSKADEREVLARMKKEEMLANVREMVLREAVGVPRSPADRWLGRDWVWSLSKDGGLSAKMFEDGMMVFYICGGILSLAKPSGKSGQTT